MSSGSGGGIPGHTHPDGTRDSLYGVVGGYTPTLWICALFVALFSLSTIVHTAQAVRFRLWWLIPTAVICGFAEILGWSGRLWSNVGGAWRLDPYLMQITTTIIAPSFLTAANFIILGRVIERLGREHSRLSPRMYSYIFIAADVIALVIQSIGGAQASRAAQTGIGDPEKGGKIMLGGIIFQMVAITFYSALAAEFLFRVHRNRPLRASSPMNVSDDAASTDKGRVSPNNNSNNHGPVAPGSDLYHKAHLMLIGLSISTLFIYIRTIYRTIELNDGWTGTIIKNERLFNVLDGMPIVVAMVTLNVFHPGWLLPSRKAVAGAQKGEA